MVVIVLGAVVLLVCSAVVGQGVLVMSGRERWEWWSPGVGFAALLILGGVFLRGPGHSKAVAFVIGVATLASLASPSVRAALREALPEGVVVAGVSLVASMLPFLVSGRAGIIGAGVNNDMGAHLGAAWWIQHQRGPVPVGALGGGLPHVGYPIGPHALADALSQNVVSLVSSFNAVLVVVAPVTALVALGAMCHAPRPARWVGALFVAFTYLAASYMAQGAFKETIEGLLVVTAAIATRAVLTGFRPEMRWRAGIPLGVILAGSVYAYSYGGLAWTAGAMVAVAVVTIPWRRMLEAAPGAAASAALLSAPGLAEIEKFRVSPFNHEVGNGNLPHAVNPIELLGVWLRPDFRWVPETMWPTTIFAVLAGVAAIVALVRFVRAHDMALPAALVPVLALAAYAHEEHSIYLEGKAFAIAAPLVALAIAGGLLIRSESPPRHPRRLALLGLAGLVALAALASSFLALRDGRVGPADHALELAQLRADLNAPTLFMPKDDLAQWELIGLPVAQGRGLYAPWWFKPRLAKPDDSLGNFFDFDSFLPMDLNRFRYAITTRTPFQSWPPRNWTQVKHTESYILWERSRRTPQRLATDFGDRPGSIFDCNSVFGKRRLQQAKGGTALILPEPIYGPQGLWNGQPVDAGQSGEMTLYVPRGSWDLSLQYAAMEGLHVEAGNVSKQMPATIDRMGPYYLVGTVHQAQSGPLTIRATAGKMGLIGRLLGAPGATRALDSKDNLPLAAVALTRHDQRPQVVPIASACGKYVDFVTPPRSLVSKNPLRQDLP